MSGLERAVGRLGAETSQLGGVMNSLAGRPKGGGVAVGAPLEKRLRALEAQFLSNRNIITSQLLQFSKYPTVDTARQVSHTGSLNIQMLNSIQPTFKRFLSHSPPTRNVPNLIHHRPPGCPSYSGSSLASEVCTLRREQRETSALLRAVRKELASGGGGSGPTAATTQRPGGRTTPPVLDNRVNILENGQLWSGGLRIAPYILFPGAADGFCVSVEAYTQRQSKIEFDNVMFSKGNVFSIKESDFQVTITILVFLCKTQDL